MFKKYFNILLFLILFISTNALCQTDIPGLDPLEEAPASGDKIHIIDVSATPPADGTDKYIVMSYILSNVNSALGISYGTTNLGTFTGSTIADNQNVKQALQALETSLETKGIGDMTEANYVDGGYLATDKGGVGVDLSGYTGLIYLNAGSASQLSLGSNVGTFLSTPSSANFFSAITDEGAYASTMFAWANAAAAKSDLGYITDLVDDGSPELGADLDMNDYLFTGVLGNTPQSKTYDDNDDDDETVGTDLTSSLILVTGDDDTDDDSIDLQDGTDAGQTITFVAYANVDSNDTFTIDVSTDSTCVNCTSIELTENGQFAQFEWNGSSWLKKWPITAIDIYADASITADDAYSAIEPLTTGINAGGSITVGQIVYYDTTATEWLLADADADGPPIEWPAWGVAVTAAGDGEAITVMTKGYYVDTGLSLTPRGLVYLSTTAGGFTQTAPSTAGDCVQVIGVAITATKILFSIDPTIYQTATGS